MFFMISQQHIIIQIIYATAWSLAVSMTTFGVFVSFAVYLSERHSSDDNFEDVIKQTILELPPKQIRQFLIVVAICLLCWMIALLPFVLTSFQ